MASRPNVQSALSTKAATPFDLRLWIGLTVMLTGTFMAVLDNFIVFVAVPTIRSKLSANFAQTQFVIAAYTLTLAMAVITGGRLGDRFGRRRMYTVGLAGFTAASVLCGLSPSANALIVFRIIQGLAAAVLSPQVLAIIRVTFSDARQRTIAFGWMGVTIGLASVSGQVIGGLLIGADLWGLSWRPVFLINLPIGLCALLFAPYVLQESRSPGLRQFDLSGALLSTLSFGLLLYPLIEGREAGWPAWSFVMLAMSATALVFFFIHQNIKTRRNDSPLVEMSLFRDSSFTVGILATLLFYTTLSPIFLSFSYLVQSGFGHSAVRAALDFSPLAVTFAVTSIIVGRISPKDTRAVLVFGLTLATIAAAAACLTCAYVRPFEPKYLLPTFALLGIGQGLFMTPLTNAILNGIHDHHAGSAAGVVTTT